MADETKKTCERCGEPQELKQYKPNLGKFPGKTVNLCDDCAGKDNKLISTAKPEEVPVIEPAVPETCAVTEVDPKDPSKGNQPVTKKFEAVPPESIQIATPKSESKPESEPKEEKPVCTEPISREELRGKLADCEKDAGSLRESKQRILAQAEQVKTKLQEVQNMINVTNVRIANYRDLLGDKG